MRYMKVIAQDRSGQGAPDTVQFEFYQDDQLLREANQTDRRRLRVFAKTFLKCAWFNTGHGIDRHLRIFSLNPSADETPESVLLHFHEGLTISYKAAVHDVNNDGLFEVTLSSDVDNDGRANRTDRARVTALAKQFLKVRWQ